MKINNAAKFIIAILLAQFAGFVGSIFTSPSIPGWYARLTKPSFTPPSWVFAPVWTTLFFLMGVAAFLVWKKGLDKKTVKVALVFFLLQLAFNSLWSYIFFGLHNLFLAFLEIIVLWLLILVTIILFWRVSKLAAWLLLPYIFWVGFAAFLNFSIWQLSVASDGNVPCTMDARQCPDGSYVGRRGPKCEFAACSGGPALPDGYSLDNYQVEKNLGNSCQKNSDCATPTEYLAQSRCPFTTLCLNNSCAVVCPGQIKRDGWQTVLSTSSGWSFQYPQQLGTTYLGPQDWPPILNVLTRPFTCPTAADENGQVKTQLKSIGNKSFCVTVENEGAAGSTYTRYLYVLEKDNQAMSLAFTIRYPQCLNYDEPRQTACKNEQAGFDPDQLALQMALTIKKP